MIKIVKVEKKHHACWLGCVWVDDQPGKKINGRLEKGAGDTGDKEMCNTPPRL